MVNENFVLIGIGVVAIVIILCLTAMNAHERTINKELFEKCVSAGNQYISGNCVIGKDKN